MKILYITNYNKIAVASGGFVNDYLNDLMFYGLYELLKNNEITELVDSTPIISLYKQYEPNIPKRHLWGGMTAFWLIDKDTVDRSNIENKIKDKYYDLIIYGAARRCTDYYDIVSKIYPANKIVILDGNDESDIQTQLSNHIYFKRELTNTKEHPSIRPISFAYPTSKLTTNITRNKTQDYGTVIPGDKSTYIFDTEQSYYNDYNASYYGVTMKKAGWDCMRHYEILGNYCMPYFVDLEHCPNTILTEFPKNLIQEGMRLTSADKFDEVSYYNILDEMFDITKNKLTTKAVAKYILNQI